MTPIDRRTALRLGVPAAFAVVGVRPVLAEPIDGKGNDVCPCAIDVDEAVLGGDGTVEVSGPRSVANPPEEITVDVQVRDGRGARAIGATTFDCEGSEGDEDAFSVTATVRGERGFVAGEDVTVRARAHVRPPDAPDVVFRWRWSGALG